MVDGIATAYLARHGENLANITKEFSHRLVDYDLTDKGRLQAAQLAERFRCVSIDRIVSSPLKRAIQTAMAVSGATGLAVDILEEFREVDVGDLEKRPPDEAAWATYLRVAASWNAGRLDAAFPGGEDGHALVERFRRGLERAIEGGRFKNVLVVGHGGIFAAGVVSLCGLVDRRAFLREPNPNCSVSELALCFGPAGMTARLVSWADASHIHGPAADFVDGLPARPS